MCGIFGYYLKENVDKEFNELLSGALSHRGPDEVGTFSIDGALIGNNRLSIIDIENGTQPFYSADRKIALVQNGEIYNYVELRLELISLGITFDTDSDTEVLLNAYLSWGVEFVKKLNGMFAIAILDKRKDSLLLFRDRLGVKPCYIYRKGNDFMFASEIKEFLALDTFDKEINHQALYDYLKLNYVPIPSTIFANVKHLPPGHFAKLNLGDSSYEEHEYWNVRNVKIDYEASEEEALHRLKELFEDAVRIRLRSDVEVGAFLSGGLDSSLVVAEMSRNRSERQSLSTYSIGFNEERFDESRYAQYINDKYSCIGHLKTLDDDILKYWEIVTFHNDQPHGDISFIPTFLLSEFAGADLKVVLTGDGGDELFAGYTKYKSLENDPNLNHYLESTSVFSNELLNQLLTPDFMSRINQSNVLEVFSNVTSVFKERGAIDKALYFDMKQLLPGNNLVKPDKMAMANGLETRSPFLDYRLFEFAFSLPEDFKLKNGETKYILKKLGEQYFDASHVYRDKQMFTVPVGEWFKERLSSYLLEFIQSDSLVERGIWNVDKLKQMAMDHIDGKHNFTRELRAVVNLEIWFRVFIDSVAENRLN